MALAGLASSSPAGATTSSAVACGDVYGPEGLVDAINDANTAGGGTITLAQRCTYTLTRINHGDDGLPAIESPITINGGGSTILRSQATQTAAFRVLHVESGSLTLNATIVSGGKTDLGAGIVNQATLTVNGSRLSGNSASHFGGGIYNEGTVAVTSTQVTNNSAGEDGGGIDQSGAQFNLTNSQVTQNRAGGFGGGIDSGSKLEVSGSQVNANTALLGAGIANENSASPGAAVAKVTSSQVNNNTASSPTSTHPFGGGVLNDTSSILTLTSTQVSNNVVSGPGGTAKGGAISNRGELTIGMSALTGNTASAPGGMAEGGGVFNDGSGTVKITSSSVSSNRAVATTAEGGGIFNNGSTVTLVSSVVAGNTPNNCRPPGSVPGCSG
jgi:hypothetical protein